MTAFAPEIGIFQPEYDHLGIASVFNIRIASANPGTSLSEVSVLETVEFGLGAAQQEQQLRNYFYRSGSFKLASSDKTYLILGAKGAGKSAIFRMFQELEKEIAIFRAPNLWVADEPQLRDHW